MSGWRETTLGEVVVLQRGHDLTEGERTHGTVPVIGSAGQNGWHNVARAPGPGVTVGRSGASAGVVTFVREAYWPHNTALYVKDFKGNDPLFVAFLLRTLRLAELNSGAAQPSLNRNFLYPVPVRLPSADTQRRIASILGAYDDLIEVNRRRVAVLEEMARGLFEEWFVRFRFPGHEGVVIEETPGGPLPQGWSWCKLSEVADLCLGKMLDKKKNKGNLRPYLANINVRWGSLELQDLREMRFEDRELERYGLRPGDIVMCEGGEPGRCVLWRDQVPGMMIQKALHRIRPAEGVESQYLYYALFNIGRSGGLEQYFTGATIKHLPGEQLAKVNVAVPGTSTQSRFATVVRPMLQLTDTLIAQCADLVASRDLLLPRLISGQLSVEAAERELEAAA